MPNAIFINQQSTKATINSSVKDIVSELPGLNSLWAESVGDSDVCVAILDGPVDLSHPCFEGANITCLDTLVSGVANEGFASAHGTHVASIIFSQHKNPIHGIAPGCSGLIVPIFGDGARLVPCSQIDLARAITQAVQHGAHIINISGGEFTPSGEVHPLLNNAIQFCNDSGVLIVSAAGNDGCECIHIPAALPSVLAVGAMDSRGLPLNLSNWGNSYQTQGILAPGENIPGASPGGGITLNSGTSFATPIVSGIVALLLSIQLKRGGKPDPYAMRDALLKSAHPCNHEEVADCSRFLVGRINIDGAYTLITKGISADDRKDENVRVQEIENVNTEKSADHISTPYMQPAEPMVPEHELAVAHPTVLQEEHNLLVKSKLLTEERKREMNDMEETDDQQEEEDPESQEDDNSLDESANMTSSSLKTISLRSAPATVFQKKIVKSDAKPNYVVPSQSSCSGGPTSLVYALGTLSYDFGTETRRDSILRDMLGMENEPGDGNPNPNDPAHLLAYLEESPWSATSVIWTLNLDGTPIYAIMPYGPFAGKAYELLRQFLMEQMTEGVERIAVPGVVGGQVTLLSGQVVPLILPETRGMRSWSTTALVEAVCGKPPKEHRHAQQAQDDQSDEDKEIADYNDKMIDLMNFLERIYFEFRNLGLTPSERALNYSGTQGLLLGRAFEDSRLKGKELGSIDVEQSPIKRPGTDCWDLKLTFFNPLKLIEEAKVTWRLTIDVSDVIPVALGQPKFGFEY